MNESGEHDRASTVVVGYRPDSSGERALAVAVDIGRRLAGRLRVVHVVDLTDYPVDVDSADWEQRGEETLDRERDRVTHTLVGCGLDWQYEVRHGDPACELDQAARENDALLIVLGSRGGGVGATVSRWVRPSVTHRTIRCQHRPVLVVPARRSVSEGWLSGSARNRHHQQGRGSRSIVRGAGPGRP
ncbi:universal stress protein [Pseudonocardia acaciae]|uniref:universal stress protein n=1 Tax=Pseudonocardia acaciae TaxID=551276 RepID=UPI00147072AC|nr:universal stress protein [Pseudonocardia acaciae]